MKLVMNERMKHRLTGIVVIISVAVICLPAMMKKSNRHFEESMSISLKLPAKPLPPTVIIPKQAAMLNTIKEAHVDVPSVPDAPHPSLIAKAEPLSQPPRPKSILAKVDIPLKSVITPAKIPSKTVSSAKLASVMQATMKKGYGIQLASFTQQRNADYLVARLRKQGYEATYTVFKGEKGQFYKVVVGMGSKRDQAVLLKKQIAATMKLNGYIVQTGVS